MGYVELDTDYIANALVKTRRETDRYCCYYVKRYSFRGSRAVEETSMSCNTFSVVCDYINNSAPFADLTYDIDEDPYGTSCVVIVTFYNAEDNIAGKYEIWCERW